MSQVGMMLRIKRQSRFISGVLDINKSDCYAFRRHCRNLKYVLRWHEEFKGANIIDVGAGIGAAYHALKFCQPKSLIALEPNQENFDFLKTNVPYDEIIQQSWQDYDFKEGDCVIVRSLLITDYAEFVRKLYQHKVALVVMNERYVNIDKMEIFAKDWLVGPDWTPGRFTHDRQIDELHIPSISYIRYIFYKHGYRLTNENNIYADDGNKDNLYPYFNLCYRRTDAKMSTSDSDFFLMKDELYKRQLGIMYKGNKK